MNNQFPALQDDMDDLSDSGGLDHFISAVEAQFKQSNPGQSVATVRQKLISRCMDRWLIMGRSEKKFFSHCLPPFKKRKSSISKPKKRTVRDPNQPKRALTAYLYFCKEQRKLFVQNGTTSSSLGDVTREIAKRWKEVTPEQKEYYDQMAATDRQRYQNEMEIFKRSRASSVGDDVMSSPASVGHQEPSFSFSFGGANCH